MTKPLRIGVVGASGRMGRMVINNILHLSGCELSGASEVSGSKYVGTDVGFLVGAENNGVIITDDTEKMFTGLDVVIDFTIPDATQKHAEIASNTGCALIVGTTGMEQAHRDSLLSASNNVPIVMAPNMAAGVNLLFAITQQVAKVLDEDFDIEIVEMHHKHKIDSPSGTALGLGEAAAKGRGIDFNSSKVLSREGIIGERQAGNIGFATMRGGDVVGDHTVVFAGAGERIEISHKATDRAIFARGALRAAFWAVTQPAGLYSMNDVLGLNL